MNPEIFLPTLSKKDVDDLKEIIETGINSDNEEFVFKTLNRTMNKLTKIPGAKKMKKVEEDKYINHFVRLKRIGYVAIGKVKSLDVNSRYDVEVVKIESGETKVTVGSNLIVSTVEMKKIGQVMTGSYSGE